MTKPPAGKSKEEQDKMANHMVGHLREFDPLSSDWIIYKARLEQYFLANQICDDVRKRAILLNCCSENAYKLIFNLCVPEKPEDVNYSTLLEYFDKHFVPVTSQFPARYNFYMARKIPTETIAEWSARIRNLAAMGNFEKKELACVLRDMFIVGLGKSVIMDRLFEEDVQKLTFAKAVEIAVSKEAARQFSDKEPPFFQKSNAVDIGRLRSSTSRVQAARSNLAQIHHTGGQAPTGTEDKSKKKCNVCGYKNHSEVNCHYRDLKCHFCNKVGHLASVCKKKKFQKSNNFYLEEDSNLNLESLFKIESECSEPIIKTFIVEHIPMKFEIDTGASVSVISKKLWENVLPHVKLSITDKIFKDYTGNKIRPVGVASVAVKFNNTISNVNLYVVDNGGPPLVGREWLSKFKLEVVEMKALQPFNKTDATLQAVIGKYNVFSSELGLFNKTKISLRINEDSKAKFFKPRPLPFALRNLVETEINQLVDLGILVPVSFSNWATPIVPILKDNETLGFVGTLK